MMTLSLPKLDTLLLTEICEERTVAGIPSIGPTGSVYNRAERSCFAELVLSALDCGFTCGASCGSTSK